MKTFFGFTLLLHLGKYEVMMGWNNVGHFGVEDLSSIVSLTRCICHYTNKVNSDYSEFCQ